jgi:glycosyltransferase involved in cell wall biosynthesis
MFFSILIPVYNVSRYITECLESVLKQTEQDFEVIIADDGSTDGSGVICDEYAAEFPEKIRVIHKANEGITLTRRQLFREAKGEYCIFIDSDDYVSLQLLSTVRRIIESCQSDLVMYNLLLTYPDGSTKQAEIPFPDMSVFEGEAKKLIYKERIRDHWLNSLCTMAVKRSIVDISADYTPWLVKRGEDKIMMLPLITNARKIVYINAPLYYYRKGTQSATSSMSSADYDSFMTGYQRTMHYIAIWGMEKELTGLYSARELGFFCTYLRNMYNLSKNNADKSFEQVFTRLSKDDMFIQMQNNYDPSFFRKKRMANRTRIISGYVINGQIKPLKRYFAVLEMLSYLKGTLEHQ